MNRNEQVAALNDVASNFNKLWVQVIRTEVDHMIILCKGVETAQAVRKQIMQAGPWALEVMAGLKHNQNRYIKVHFTGHALVDYPMHAEGASQYMH